MRRWAIRLGIPLLALLVASQFALPAYYEHRAADRLTTHGGTAHVHVSVFPALRLLFGRAGKLTVEASNLSVDLEDNEQDVFKRLDDFKQVTVDVTSSRAGPFTISGFRVRSAGDHEYAVAITGDGNAADVARYAGDRLGGGFGQALAGLAASALGGFTRPIPFDARMYIGTKSGFPVASDVVGSVAGLPAGPLAQVVANALLGAL